jgi:hypothetical protein
MNRRELLRTGVRTVLSAALAALGRVTLREERGGPWSHTCSGDGICRACDFVSDCALPQALSYRRAAGKETGPDG